MATRKVLLAGEINRPDQMSLAQLMHLPGADVLVRIWEAAVAKYMKDAMLVNPAAPSYDTEVKAKQTMAFVANDMSREIRDSIQYHCDEALALHTEEKAEEKSPVRPRFKVPVAPTTSK